MTPKILLLDIETFPNITFTWGFWQQNVIEVLEHWYILSYAWEWYGNGEGAQVRAIPDTKGKKDEILIWELWRLLDEADYVIAHNGKAFDTAKINTRFFEYGMKPPSPYKVIDTLLVARGKLAFNSNKLNDLCKDAGLGEKVKHVGFPLWLACHLGVMTAWKRMKRYNLKDIVLLRRWFKKALPWIEGMAVATGPGQCPNCGSKRMLDAGTIRYKTTEYFQYRCGKCGKYARATTTLISKRDKPLIGIPVNS